MKFYDLSVIIIVSILVVSAIVGGISYKVLGPDSPITKEAEKVVETEAEALILKETGVDIPLVPKPQTTTTTGTNVPATK